MRQMLQAPTSSDNGLDELFRQAVEVVTQYDRASAPLLQRRLSIGYARAARLIDQLEAAGVVSQSEGSNPRNVLVRSYDEYVAKGGKTAAYDQEHIYQTPKDYKMPTDFKLSPVGDKSRKPISDAINTKEYKDSKTDYPVILGYDSQGKLTVTTLARVGNLIITGNPQSMKLNWVDTVVTGLLLNQSPQELRLVLVDLTHYLDLYDGIPQLLSPVISDFGKGISALRWTMAEIDRRMKLFVKAGTRSIETYNYLSGIDPFPRILILYSCEWADVESMSALSSIASSGLRAGIHLLITANRMSDKNLSADIKADIPNRAVFTVTSSQDSKLAGVEGAENLKEGEMLIRIGNSDPKKLLTVYAPEINVKEVVQAVIAAGKQ